MRYHDLMQPSLKHRILRFIGHLDGVRGRDRILRAFSHPERCPSYPFEVDFYGKKYTGNLTSYIDWIVFYYGSMSPNELHLLGALADALHGQGKPVNFFDVGANIGHHTLYMSSHADRIFSFEPFSVVRDEMKRKLAHAGVTNATIFPVAMGDHTETGSYFPPTGANQGTGTLGNILPDNAAAEPISVEVVRGDEFFAANNLPPISLLKIDVEGYEVKALAGMKETLWRDRPPIVMEMQPGSRGAAVLDMLYPDHLLFKVANNHGKFELQPYAAGETDDVLVLPKELAGIVPGSNL